MKVFLGALLFLFLAIPRVFAISEFEWVDLQMMKICRINLVKSQFECKEFRGAWKSEYPLILEGIKPEDIPAVCYPVALPLKNTMLFSIPGTGQVYQFNPSLKTFKRLDETFFRGYNFYAVQFIRKDSLFSMGGEGFWRDSNLFTYFDFKSKEWEEIKTYGDLPRGLMSMSASVNSKKDKIIAIETYATKEYLDKTLGLFEFDMNSHTWSKMGNIDLQEIKDLKQSTANFNLIGELMFFSDPQQGLFADPKENKIYRYQGPKKLFFLIEAKLYLKGDKIYSIYRNKNKSEEAFQVDSLSFSELKKDSITLENLYYTESKISWEALTYLFLCILLAISIYYNLKYLKRRKDKTEDIFTDLPLGGVEFIALYKQHGEHHEIGTDEISVMLGCENKAFDTQRQYRAQFIISMNQYFYSKYRIKDAIYRKNSTEDKRFIKYCLKEEVFLKL